MEFLGCSEAKYQHSFGCDEEYQAVNIRDQAGRKVQVRECETSTEIRTLVPSVCDAKEATGGSRMAYTLSYSNHYSSHTNHTWDKPLVLAESPYPIDDLAHISPYGKCCIVIKY